MVKIKKVYGYCPQSFEENSGEILTVQSDYIPIEQQVSMIMKGQITVGNLDDGFDDEYLNLDEESPDEIFQDAVDLGTQYQDDIRLAVAESFVGSAGNTPAQKPASSDDREVANERSGESDADVSDTSVQS